MTHPDLIAAVDLGSNSFHMVIARVEADGLHPIDARKARVRLAAGLDDEGRLSAEAQERALVCLRDFGRRLEGLPAGSVRAVGTSTLRKAHNALPFLVRARRALGHPIQVITGRDEALTIYRGVADALGDAPERRLVIDIGGGSTECVLGLGLDPLRAASLDMGCVAFTQRFFATGRIYPGSMRRAVRAAAETVDPVRRVALATGWTRCVGSSGTIRAVSRILRNQGITSGAITPAGLAWLRQTLVDVHRVDRLRLDGLSETRRPVIAGGVAVLSGVFDALGIRRMHTSRAALREGVLLELLAQRAAPSEDLAVAG
ncbi:MAG: Ppx/GppA family phosphatase [Alphaproteobacteria bacterium]|nr:Ppx/GppA family phosphatase [Alphaproteobacteria bacterium]